jgi:hypothetical protein
MNDAAQAITDGELTIDQIADRIVEYADSKFEEGGTLELVQDIEIGVTITPEEAEHVARIVGPLLMLQELGFDLFRDLPGTDEVKTELLAPLEHRLNGYMHRLNRAQGILLARALLVLVVGSSQPEG